MELKPISDFSQRSWGFHTVKGSDDPGELGLIPPFVGFRDIERPPDRGWDPIIPGWSCSIICDPQPIRDRPVGGVGDYFYTVRIGISPDDIRVCSRVVGVV